MSAKLNKSADKVDGVLTSRPKLPRLARHEGRDRPHQRGGAIGQEARRRRQFAGEGHRRRSHPLQQFGLARIRGARRRGAARGRRHRSASCDRSSAIPSQVIFGSRPVAARISRRAMMGRRGCGFRVDCKFAAASVLALALVGVRERTAADACMISPPRALRRRAPSGRSFASARRPRPPISTAITSSCANRRRWRRSPAPNGRSRCRRCSAPG